MFVYHSDKPRVFKQNRESFGSPTVNYGLLGSFLYEWVSEVFACL
jgi:hypothetical protein